MNKVNNSGMEEISKEKKNLNQAKQLPKDAQVIISILRFVFDENLKISEFYDLFSLGIWESKILSRE